MDNIQYTAQLIKDQFDKRFKIDKAALENRVDKAIHEPRAREALKKQLLETIKRDSSQINAALLSGLLGTGKSPFQSSRDMSASIRRIKTYTTVGGKAARRFISQDEWRGDWYKYKATLVGKRLHYKRHGFSNSKDALRTYHVVANKQRKDTRSGKGNESSLTKVNVNDNLDVTRKRSKAINNNSLNVVNDRLPSNVFNDLGQVGSDLRSRQPTITESSATARAVLMARHLNKEKDHTVRYSSRTVNPSSRSTRKMPYVSTGSLAHELAESFRVVDVEYNNVNKSKSRFNFSLKYELDIDSIPADVKEAWVYSKPFYKQYVLQGTSDLVLEYLTEILKTKYKR